MAKRAGSKKNWKTDQTLHWNGKEYKRDCEEYQQLLDKAYDALSTNSSFVKALLATQNATLKHSIGRTNLRETVLTQREFCSRLTNLRTKFKSLDSGIEW
jgi:ribonucleotide reductase beta subunit family protein with ferritin-like domain